MTIRLKSFGSLLATGLALLLTAFTSLTARADAPPDHGYIKANGLDYYYAASGHGEPLLLLHGGLGSGDMFAPILPRLTEHRRVITVDLQGHGRTALGTRKFDLIAMGDDMAVILDKLGLKQADVMGYSFGGGVAFRLAVQHPDRVRRLVLVSTGFADSGFYDDMRKQQNGMSAESAAMMMDTPMYKMYTAVAPKPEDFPRLLQSIGDFMRGHYDYSADVARLTMPTMLIFGDSDMYKPEHEVKFYQLLGGGLRDAGWQRETMSKNRLAILPDQTHYDIFFSPKLVDAALPFLDGVSGSKTWNETVDAAKK